MTLVKMRADDGGRGAVAWAAATERELARRVRLGLSVWVADDPSGTRRRLVPADAVEVVPLGTGERALLGERKTSFRRRRVTLR